MRHCIHKLAAAAALAVAVVSAPQFARAQATIDVKLDQPGITVSPSLWGIFFEEINRGGEGGIWAELVDNGAFEAGERGMMSWQTVTDGDVKGTVTPDDSTPLNGFSPRSMKFEITRGGPGRVGIANEGFKGIPVVSGAKYNASLHLAAEKLDGPVTVSLEADGKILASATIGELAKTWKKHEVVLTANGDAKNAKLVISANTPGVFRVDALSLMPADTFNNHGFRKDLAQKLADMKPAFVRFPGGCWVEGETMRDAYRWKNTIGDPALRKPTRNLWNYQCSNALGFHEYLQLCEDLGAEALYVANVGMSHREVVPMDQMHYWVQDALDAIEYAIGPVDSPYGAMRAKAGHPEPFKLSYLQIGNENGGPNYNERYKLFVDAIKAKYPQVKTIACDWGGRPNSRPIEIVDEHYYNTPQFFMANADKYDSYPRNTPMRVYVGEYAVTEPTHRPYLIGAIGEAAWMTGMERNSDIVTMSSYAPLFNNVAYTRWSPNAINFDGTRVFGSPSYYVQKMFFTNRPDRIVPSTVTMKETEGKPLAGGFGVGTWITQAEYKDIKITEDGKTVYESNFGKDDKLKADGGVWTPLASGGENSTTGDWKISDGALVQTGRGTGPFAMLSDKTFTHATLELKARKTGGEEGFLIRFNSTGDRDYMMLNLGGWQNSRHVVEVATGGGKSQLPGGIGGSIDSNRWYDIKIETDQNGAKCYLDGKLIQDVKFPKTRGFFVVAGTTDTDAIVKIVNGTDQPQAATLNLTGKTVSGPAKVTTLAGQPNDENTLDEPEKVVPKDSEAKFEGGKLSHTFPPYSVTVIRAAAK